MQALCIDLIINLYRTTELTKLLKNYRRALKSEATVFSRVQFLRFQCIAVAQRNATII